MTGSPANIGPLLTAARAGDRGAMDELFLRFYPSVRNMVHHSLATDLRRKRPWLAAMFSTGDVVQEVFQSVIRDMEHFDGESEGAFVAYLVTLIKNRLTDAIRFHEAMRRDSRRAPHAGDSLDDQAAESRDPAEIAAAEEQLRRYTRALATLGPRERTLLRERLHGTTTFAELAQQFGYPSEDAARKAFCAAQARLLLSIQNQKS